MTTIHRRIKTMLMDRYDTAIINNVCRADYVECLVACVLGDDWFITWRHEWDWAAWDCEHEKSRARIEIKQAAARQTWDREAIARRRYPSFDIAARTGYWTRDGKWVDSPGRPADLYVFAWHDERRDTYADHRDTSQWIFYVVPEHRLPKDQKKIGLNALNSLAHPCDISQLKQVVENACPKPKALKATLEINT